MVFPSLSARHLKTVSCALVVACTGAFACETREDTGQGSRLLSNRKAEPACVVAKTSALNVTNQDVSRVRMAMFPPPEWDESVRLATAAALASTMPSGQVKEDSDTRGMSVDPWLSAYERLVRLVKLEGGGAPSDVARRLDAQLKARWHELNGRAGPCGTPLHTTGWTSSTHAGTSDLPAESP